MTTQDKLLSAISALDPGGPWGTIGGIFDQMEICESVITKTRSRHPEHDTAIWNAFRLLMPSKLLHEAPELVYRAHCVEILERVVKGIDTTLGTKAEIMMGLSKTSLKSPLTHTALVLYAQLFQEILPDTSIADEISLLSTLSWSGEIDRLLAELAQEARVPSRKPKEVTEWRAPPVE